MNWQYRRLLNTHLLLIFLLTFWFLPLTHPFCRFVDEQAFIWLNQSLTWSKTWQYLWGYLNHPAENWLNLIVMLSINFLGVAALTPKDRSRALAMVLYFWFFFQLGLFCTHALFSDLLAIERESASLVIKPFVKLSNAIGVQVKDYSDNSFPAGHTFVLIFWANFTSLYAPKFYRYAAYFVAGLLCFPRLFTGAHWLSDIIFTVGYALVWFAWATCTPFYEKAIAYINRLTARILPTT